MVSQIRGEEVRLVRRSKAYNRKFNLVFAVILPEVSTFSENVT